MLIKSIAFALLLVAKVSAFSFGKCPQFTPSTDASFNITQYLGKWYEIARADNIFESGLKCVSATYESLPDGKISIVNRGLDNSNEEKTAKGVARVPDQSNLLKVKFATLSPEAPYWIAKTETSRFALIVSCVDFFNVVKYQNVWILARESTLDQATTSDLLKEMSEMKLPTTNLILVDQVNCPRPSSSSQPQPSPATSS